MKNLKNRKPVTASKDVSEKDIRQNILPMTENYETATGDLYTSMGFSIDEIREMGDFPDYAMLSGVPLPNAHGDSFDIDKALPRPYRPFRWAYHQTMCKESIFTVVKEN